MRLLRLQPQHMVVPGLPWGATTACFDRIVSREESFIIHQKVMKADVTAADGGDAVRTSSKLHTVVIKMSGRGPFVKLTYLSFKLEHHLPVQRTI